MAEEAQQILAIRSQTLAQLEQLQASPKPSYAIDGQRVSWQEYLRELRKTVDWCDRKLIDCQPFECRSQGAT